VEDSAKQVPTKVPKKVTVPWVAAAPAEGRRVVTVTAYDFQMARVVDAAGADVALVGDSLANVVLGYDDTLAVTMEEMLHHVKAVRRGLTRALLVADMPYGSFHLGERQAVENAMRFVKEGGAEAVKIEGARASVVAAMVAAEVPVMAHLGLTPQSIHKFGGYKVQGRGEEAREALLAAAVELEAAGAFSLVLECVPSPLAAEVTARLSIPTIGIGAGPGTTGQVLVYHDLLGLEERIAPRFVRRYAELGLAAREAVAAFADDVRAGRFPSEAESYGDPSFPSGPVDDKVAKLYG